MGKRVQIDGGICRKKKGKLRRVKVEVEGCGRRINNFAKINNEEKSI